MLATVDGCEDARSRVEVPPVQLTGVRQLEDALANLHCCAVHFIEEEEHGVVAGFLEPVRGVPAGAVARNGGQTHEIAFRHLGRTALHNRKVEGAGELIDQLGLTDPVGAAHEDRQGGLDDEGNNGIESGEIDGHVGLSERRG